MSAATTTRKNATGTVETFRVHFVGGVNYPVSKIAWGDVDNAADATDATPFPVKGKLWNGTGWIDAPGDGTNGAKVNVAQAGSALGDSLANPNAPLVGAAGLTWNPKDLVWERDRGNFHNGLWNGTGADGPRTTTFASADQINHNGLGIFLHLRTTATPGTADTIKLRMATRSSYGFGFVLWESAAFTTAGPRAFLLYPGTDKTYAPAATELVEVQSLRLPRTFTCSVIHSSSGPSFTYDLSYTLLR